MRLPHFIIAGAQKSGTSWLLHQLGQHPELYLPDRELHFFDKQFNYRKGLDWYASHFEAARPEQLLGEKTPDYIWVSEKGAEGHLPRIPERICQVLPEVKLVFVFRDPVDRAISAAKHVVKTGRVGPWHSLDELLIGGERERLERHGVIDYGRYERHLRAYLEWFPRDRILVLIFEEDVVDAPEGGLRKVCRFLGVNEEFEFEGVGQPQNRTRPHWMSVVARWVIRQTPLPGKAGRLIPGLGPRWEPSVSHEARERLTKIYRPHNEKLFALLGRDIPAWNLEEDGG